MVAIREFHEVKSGRITVNLPSDFTAKRVEIIILPIEEPADKLDKASESLQSLLLSAPTLTDEEANEYEQVREWMDEWRVTDF